MSESDDNGTTAKPAIPETKLSKLKALKCFEEIHKYVLEGVGPTEIARIIQDERHEYTDIGRPSLIEVLKNYRASLAPTELVANRLPAEFTKAVSKLEEGVDEVKELEWLVKFQKRRLKIDGGTEKKINKLLPTMTQEVRAHAEVLRSLANVKMDLGLNKRHLGEMTVDATLIAEVAGRYGKASVAKVLQSAESRQKVMGVAEKFLALADRGEKDEPEPEDAVIDVTPEPEKGEATSGIEKDGEAKVPVTHFPKKSDS